MCSVCLWHTLLDMFVICLPCVSVCFLAARVLLCSPTCHNLPPSLCLCFPVLVYIHLSYCFRFFLIFCSPCVLVYLVILCCILYFVVCLSQSYVVSRPFIVCTCLHFPLLESPYSYLPQSCVPCLVLVVLHGTLTVCFHVPS